MLTALLLVFVIRAFTSFFSEYAFQKVGLSTVRDLRNELYERMIHQSHRFFSERSTGEMVSRVVSDADAIQAAVSTRMGDLFQESVTLVGLIVYVFCPNPELALMSSRRRAAASSSRSSTSASGCASTTHRSQERMADIATLLEETIRGVRIVKAFTMEPFEIGRFREATRTHLALESQGAEDPGADLAGDGAAGRRLHGGCSSSTRSAASRAGTLTSGEFVSFLAALALMYRRSRS